MPVSPVINVRLPAEELAMLDTLVATYNARKEGVNYSRSDIIRLAIREEHKRLQRLLADKARQR